MDEHDPDHLISLEKRVDGQKTVFEAPNPGSKIDIRLNSVSSSPVSFVLSVFEKKRSSSIALSVVSRSKRNINLRSASLCLVRIDIDPDGGHTNPDGSVVRGSHVHIADPVHGDKVAYGFSTNEARSVIGDDCTSMMAIMEGMKRYCHIEDALSISWRLEI